jgi:uncharacterized protein (TIGR00290 family)
MTRQVYDNKIKTVLNWSSGKDAAMVLYLLQQTPQYKVTHLLTTINEEHSRIVMHGVREELLDIQAERIGLPLKKIHLPASPQDTIYKQAMANALTELQQEGITTVAFGDIFLEDLKTYREQQLQSVGFDAVFPLWKRDTRQMVEMVEYTGIEAMIICVNEKFLDKDFLGRKIDRSFLNDLPPNVDPCGENGEFHTFVFNAPYFKSAIPIAKGEITYRQYRSADNDKDKWNTGFYFLDIKPNS